jgi:cytochrome P460
VAISQPEDSLALILANPVAIDAYRAGVPGNGKPFPDGSKLVKIHWKVKKSAEAPAPTMVPDTQKDVGFMVRDSKRFADSGGWGWAEFKYDAASDTFTPKTLADNPPQGNDAKCGFACHTIAKAKDYVFTAYPTL